MLFNILNPIGEVPERLKGTVLKTVRPEMVSRVQISPSPIGQGVSGDLPQGEKPECQQWHRKSFKLRVLRPRRTRLGRGIPPSPPFFKIIWKIKYKQKKRMPMGRFFFSGNSRKFPITSEDWHGILWLGWCWCFYWVTRFQQEIFYLA